MAGTDRFGRGRLLAIYGPCLALFVACALWQNARVNLTATAGGQYPYLRYAEGMAREGLLSHWGDRNRMPLVPAIVSAVYRPDWEAFSAAAATAGLTLNLCLFAGVAWLCHRLLRPALAVPAVLVWGLVVLLPKASFVQAETPYYALLLISLWLTVVALRTPGLRPGAAAGAAYGVTYLAKASVLPALAAWWVVAAAMAWRGGADRPVEAVIVAPPTRVRGPMRGRHLTCIAAGVIGFVVVAGLYLYGNQTRFGRLFYNVNSTWYFWCDSWAEAEALAARYDLEHRPPPAGAADLPGPARYFREHSIAHAARRLAYGAGVLLTLAASNGYGWCLLVAIALAIIAPRIMLPGPSRPRLDAPSSAAEPAPTAAQPGSETSTADSPDADQPPPFDDRAVALYVGLVLPGYFFAYCWYVPVAYGDRFILSLAMPVMILALRRIDAALHSGAVRAGETTAGSMTAIHGRKARCILAPIYAVVLAACAWSVASVFRPPSEAFVRFYFNESRARIAEGRLSIAIDGLEGVTQLDRSFAPAWRELGAARLLADQPAAAAEALRQAIHLQPDHPDAHNSLGAALARTGDIDAAIDAFDAAARLDPTRAETWYNLAALAFQQGDLARAEAALAKLATLDTNLAERLRRQMNEGDP